MFEQRCQVRPAFRCRPLSRVLEKSSQKAHAQESPQQIDRGQFQFRQHRDLRMDECAVWFQVSTESARADAGLSLRNKPVQKLRVDQVEERCALQEQCADLLSEIRGHLSKVSLHLPQGLEQ